MMPAPHMGGPPMMPMMGPPPPGMMPVGPGKFEPPSRMLLCVLVFHLNGLLNEPSKCIIVTN